MGKTHFSSPIIVTRAVMTAGAGNGETLTPTSDIITYDPVASRTGVLLGVGEAGQRLTIINTASGAYSITFASSATSNVYDGANVVISQGQALSLYWSASLALWIPASGGNTTIASNAVTTAKILDANVTTSKIADAAVTPAKTNVTEARTATVGGGTTGVISDTSTFVTVTSSVNTKAITLPTPTPGRVVSIYVGANGYALQSSTPASVAINGGTGASAVSTLAASTTVIARCVTATAWLCSTIAADGTVTVTTAAA